MDGDFQAALKLVLVDEGGLDDDPNDHGGRTAHGITQSEFTAWLVKQKQPNRDVWTITPQELTTIYHDSYWEPLCGGFPSGLDYVFFDNNVNSGQSQAVKTMQRALGVPADGNCGPVTKAAIAKLCATPTSTTAFITKYCNARRSFYKSLKQFSIFGKGWLARVTHVQAAAIQMAQTGEAERVGLNDDLKAQATAKADPSNTKVPFVTKAVAVVASAAAALAAGVGVYKLKSPTKAAAPPTEVSSVAKPKPSVVVPAARPASSNRLCNDKYDRDCH